MFPRGINTETPPFAATNDAAKLLRKNECCKFSNAPFCAGAEWRTMAHFFGGVFLNFSENDHLHLCFLHAVSQVRGQLPHKSRDNPLPCAIFVVPLHRIRHLSRIADTAPLNRRATKASALPKNPRFSGAPRKTHRTLIALSSHYHRTHGLV